jgi:hypothetical protein
MKGIPKTSIICKTHPNTVKKFLRSPVTTISMNKIKLNITNRVVLDISIVAMVILSRLGWILP